MQSVFHRIPRSVFILYLIISANFLASLLGCSIQRHMQNMYMKHLFGFMTMLFFVVLTTETDLTPNKQISFAFLFYIVFIITSKMDYRWWEILIVMLTAYYIIDLYKKYDKTKKETVKTLQTVQNIILWAISIVVILGSASYYNKKQTEYKKSFNFQDFFIGKPICKRGN